ncbi:MAG: sugar phosphate isomerase/epimerase [Bacteroidales bacterium]|nr:sugar phosphate isomerase/epimerase [Bacteroidales bacterium]
MRYNPLLLLSAVIIAAAVSHSCGPKYEFNLDEHLGICGIGWAEPANDAGLDYLEANVSGFLMPEKSDEEFAANKALAATITPPIYSANGFFPGEIKVVGPDADIDRAVKYSETAIRRANEIGIKVLVLGSSGSRNIPEGFDRAKAEEQFTGFLKRIAPAAEKYGVIVALEPLQTKESNFINTVKEGAEIARNTGSDNICVIADLFHMARMNEGPEDIITSADKLVHCHIAECEERTAPGVKGDDFTPYFKALKEIKYTGRISFECSWQDINTQLPKAVGVMREQISSVK